MRCQFESPCQRDNLGLFLRARRLVACSLRGPFRAAETAPKKQGISLKAKVLKYMCSGAVPLPQGRVLRVQLAHGTAGYRRQADCIYRGESTAKRRALLMGARVRQSKAGRMGATERPRQPRERLVDAWRAGHGRVVTHPQVLVEAPPPGARSSREAWLGLGLGFWFYLRFSFWFWLGLVTESW